MDTLHIGLHMTSPSNYRELGDWTLAPRAAGNDDIIYLSISFQIIMTIDLN